LIQVAQFGGGLLQRILLEHHDCRNKKACDIAGAGLFLTDRLVLYFGLA